MREGRSRSPTTRLSGVGQNAFSSAEVPLARSSGRRGPPGRACDMVRRSSVRAGPDCARPTSSPDRLGDAARLCPKRKLTSAEWIVRPSRVRGAPPHDRHGLVVQGRTERIVSSTRTRTVQARLRNKTRPIKALPLAQFVSPQSPCGMLCGSARSTYRPWGPSTSTLKDTCTASH